MTRTLANPALTRYNGLKCPPSEMGSPEMADKNTEASPTTDERIADLTATIAELRTDHDTLFERVLKLEAAEIFQRFPLNETGNDE